MTIYIDRDFKCHVSDDGTMNPVEAAFFDGKCAAFVEGYRFVPAEQSWTRSDGAVFRGEMIARWKPWDELDAAQRAYERELLRQYEQALAEIEAALGVTE